MEMTKTYCSEVSFNLESLSNCNFLNEIFFSFIDNLSPPKNGYRNKEPPPPKKKISTLFYIVKASELFKFMFKLKKVNF